MFIIEVIILFFTLLIGIAVGIIMEDISLKKWFQKQLDDIYNQKECEVKNDEYK